MATAVSVGLVLMFGFGLLGVLGTGGGRSSVVATSAPPTTAPPADPPPCPPIDGSAPRRLSFPRAPAMCIDPARTYQARFTTTAGTFEAVLDAHRSPLAVNNFVFLARYHFYDDLPFYKVETNYYAQSGDPVGEAVTGPGYLFPDDPLPGKGEYKVGSLLMAHDRANANGSQFIVLLGPKGAALGPVFPLFGQVTAKGVDALRAINAGGDATGSRDAPPRVVQSIRTVEILQS